MFRLAPIAWLSAAIAATLAPGQASERAGTRLPLKDVALEEGARLGLGVRGAVQKRGLSCDVKGRRYVLVDLDGDGAVRAGADGILLEGHLFVVALREPWLCELGQCDLRLEGRDALVLTPRAVAVEERILAEASEVNAVRMRAGLPLAVVDEAMSSACGKHCEFLKRNGLTEAWKGGMVHFENKKLPGYTEEGERAGWGSAIQTAAASYRESVAGWSSTFWHALDLLHPRLERFGAALRHGVAMFYPAVGEGDELASPLCHPPDGARLVPRLFSLGAGEVPAPFADDPKLGAGSGHPVIVRLPPAWKESKIIRFTLTDDRGRAVAGRSSSPAAPGNPKRRDNAGCAFFLPEKALSANSTFRARLEMAGHPPQEWSFTTASK
jgi:hypothetical protein